MICSVSKFVNLVKFRHLFGKGGKVERSIVEKQEKIVANPRLVVKVFASHLHCHTQGKGQNLKASIKHGNDTKAVTTCFPRIINCSAEWPSNLERGYNSKKSCTKVEQKVVVALGNGNTWFPHEATTIER